MNIFLAPRSNETSHKHFLSTIESGINYSIVEPYLNALGKKKLLNTGKLFVWGNKESKKTSWNKMKEGDYVLFYKNKKFIHYGRVLHTQLSNDLGLVLWPAKKNQKPWSCIFFLKDINPIDLPLSEINKVSNGKYKMDRIQGFMPLNEKVTDSIEKQFGSIGMFLKSFPVKFNKALIAEEVIPKEFSSIKKDATNFEKQIKDFLIKLEFEDVEGARDDFRINEIQVDVCAGWENALLVIECKSKQEMKTSNLRSVIHEFRGKIELLKRGFFEHPIYKKYNHFEFIMVTKNIIKRREDILLANQYPRIYIWDDEFLEYYSNLYRFISPYAKYNLLGEMNIKPFKSKPVEVRAFRTTRGNSYIYNFSIDPKKLLEFSFVARRHVRGEIYYQRIIDERRLKKIGDYISGGGIFPNNIIIAFKPELQTRFKVIDKIENNTEYGILEFPQDYNSCWIIDGQHRLYSFANLKDHYFNISVTAFEKLDIPDQRKFFLDINKNQKPVDSDLLWDLSGDVATEKEGIISNIIKSLNTEYSSPLFHNIYYPSAGMRNKKEKIKISALCVSVKKNKIVEEILSQNTKNPLYTKDHEQQIKNTSFCLGVYFNTCKKLFLHNWELKKNGFVLTNGGIAVFLGLFEKILVRTSQRNVSTNDSKIFEEYLRPLIGQLKMGPAELRKMRLKTTSEGGKSDLLNEFILLIRKSTNDNNFGGELKNKQINEEYLKLEEQLRKLIYAKCYKAEDENWFKNISDPYTYEIVTRRIKNLGKDNPDELYLGLTLGECFSIIRKNPDVFLPIFTDEEDESSFTSAKIFESALTNINEMRNRTIHPTGVKNKMNDEIIVQSQIERVLACISDELDDHNEQ